MTKKVNDSEKFVCVSCGYIYDPAIGDLQRGIKAGTNFTDLPTDWTCPMCYSGKDGFDPL